MRPDDNTVDPLLQRRRELELGLAKISDSRRRARCRSNTVCKQWALTEYMRRVALAAYALSECQTEPPVIYLQSCARQRHWPARERTDLDRLVEDLFVACDLTELLALISSTERSDEGVLAVAWKYVHEFSVVTYVRELNHEFGVAPPTELLVDFAERKKTEIADAVRPLSLGVRGSRRARKWVYRLRKRWGGRYRSVPTRDPVDPSELTAKVALIAACFLVVLQQKFPWGRAGFSFPKMARGACRRQPVWAGFACEGYLKHAWRAHFRNARRACFEHEKSVCPRHWPHGNGTII